MIKFSDQAISIIKNNGLDPDDVRLVLSRIATAMPHLAFQTWTVLQEKEEDQTSKGQAGFVYRTKGGEHHCHVVVGSARLAAAVQSPFGTIGYNDLRILGDMCDEAANILKVASSGVISLSDFGVHAISSLIGETLEAQPERIRGYLKFLRSLSSETYEGQRMTYGLILLRTRQRDSSAVLEFDNKRFKRLTDGVSTAIMLDVNGAISDLVPLRARREYKNSSVGRPWWIGPLADTAHQHGGIGIALTRTGDILIVNNRQLLLTQRAGEWRFWRHDNIISSIRTALNWRGRASRLDKVIAMLYRVALDLSFRRSGGLLVVASSNQKVKQLVVAESDLVGSLERTEAEKSLDKKLSNRSIMKIDRKVLADLAGLDGALVVNRRGMLAAYGAMVKSKLDSEKQGSRTRAAIGASKFGLAIKVSSDGGISVYHKEQLVIEF